MSSSWEQAPPEVPLLWSPLVLVSLLLERGEYPGAKNVSGAAFYGSAILHKLIPNWWEQAPAELSAGAT